MDPLHLRWQTTFLEVIQQAECAGSLKDAAIAQKLSAWTTLLTKAVVTSFRELGFEAAAKGHRLEAFPIRRNEYLSLDVIAFSANASAWTFPVAIAELENSKQDHQVAYSLWKVLCVHADLRIVFCYRQDPEACSDLVRFLRREVVLAMKMEERTSLTGETVVVVGTRGAAETFPYGFFKWWMLEKNTSTFNLI